MIKTYLRAIFFFCLTTLTTLYGQTTSLSGTVSNPATAVTAVTTSSVDVTSITGFSNGDTVLVIQMKGATIDETNNSTFGDISSINDAGNYEFSIICNISGNTISFQSPLSNTYSASGYVQLIRVPNYHNVIVSGTLDAPAWDVSTGTGGVLVLSAINKITLNADIDMNGRGFRGGWGTNDYSACSCGCTFGDPQYPDYFFPSASCRSASKGEGITDSIPGKEFGRGKLASGGGGGNDHNSGGGGGANYGAGGIGGTAAAPNCFLGDYCRGNYPGDGGVDLSTFYGGSKIFLGGGGGAGHANNLVGTDGKPGGGIIILLADSLVGLGNSITTTGEDVTAYNDGDGAGAGGAGGTVLLNINDFTSSALTIDVSGGKGGDIQSFNATNCKGPGGGGGGGVIWTNIPLPVTVTTDIVGGVSGAQIGSSCTGATNGALAGGSGAVIPGLTVNIGSSSGSSGTDVQVACDTYTWIDGNTYTSSNNTATWTLTSVLGCDSVVTLDLTIINSSAGVDVISACAPITWIDGNTYSSNNNTATFTLTNAVGCDSVVTLNLTMSSSISVTDVIGACDSYTWSDGNTYTSSNNTATQTLTAASGCDSIVTLDLTINYTNAATDVLNACDSYTWIDGNTYMASNNSATYTLTNVGGCDSVVTLNLTLSNSSAGTDNITACESYTWIDGNTYTQSNNTATYTLTNTAGCDSLVSLDLTINPMPDNNVLQTGIQLTSFQNGATYQWLDCDNNYAILIGETNQAFTPTVSGNYALEVTLDGCVDTSTCFVIDISGISEMYANVLTVYPNPTSDILMISGLDEVIGYEKMEIRSAKGDVVMRTRESKSELVVGKLPSGLYFLDIVHEKGTETIRFVKE